MTVAEANDPEFHPIATQIAKRCSGLPLLIKIVATNLRNKESYVWQDMLNRLSAYGDEYIFKKVHKVLESIYESLEEIKQLFLLCALFGQSNIQIQYLLTHSMGLGLFKHILTIDDARDHVLSLINKLKAKSLLLDGYMAGYVEMHNVVRNAALSIAVSEQHTFFGEYMLTCVPYKDCERISLMRYCVGDLPVSLDCPEAEVFLLFTIDLSLGIPDPFFELMKKLKVVGLSRMRLVSIPLSIGILTNLQTLCLHSCQLDNVSILGELKQLVFLSFANSNVVELPRVIEHLTQLKLLDVTRCTNLEAIPSGVLSRLCSLEELYMLNSFDLWDSEGNASLVELENLACLSTLEIQIPDLNVIPVGFKCFNQLKSYKIIIGSAWGWDVPYERSRTLKLKGEARVHLEGGTELLLRESEYLYLDGVKGIQSIYDEGFPKAKHMHVQNDFEIEHLINSTMQTSWNAFPQLKSLYLNKLHGLEKVCCGQLRMESFGKLRILQINGCGNLTSLFSFSSGKCLQQLRELEVESCENMKALVDEGIEEVHHNSEIMEFTQLRSLKLKNLPQLIGFCKLKEKNDQMGLLFSNMVSFPNLTSLEVDGCKSLKHICTGSTIRCLVQLINLKIKYCELDGEIMQSTKFEEIEEDNTEVIVFPELDRLSLLNLKNVKRFSNRYSFEFPLLTELTIEGCHTMRNFVGNVSCNESESEMATFSNLSRMDVNNISRDGGLLEGLQPLQNIERINIKYYMNEEFPPWMSRNRSPTSSFDFSALGNLVDLKLEWCYNCLQLPCLGNLPHLTNLEMSHMGKLKYIHNEFYGINNESSGNGRKIFPALRSLSVRWMENLTGWSSPSDGKTVTLFPRLRSLSILTCPKLTGFPMSDLSKLVWLEIKDCQELKVVIDEQKSIASHASLSFEGCPKLTNLLNWLPPPARSFKDLSVSRCEWLTFVPYDLQKVTNLTTLEIYCCRRLRYFPEEILSKLTMLERLSIGAFSEELDGFCYLNRIKYLERLRELEIWGSDFLGREMCFLPNQLQHLSALKSLKVMGFTAMKALPEWLMNLQSLRFLSLDYCRRLGCESTATIIQGLWNLTHLSIRSCPVLQGSESEWLQPLHAREIEVELSHVSEVRVRLGY